MKLNVIRQRGLWWAISAICILAGIIAMVILQTQIGAPLRPGLDFKGGTRLQVELDCSQPGNCDKPISLDAIREVLKAENQGDASLQLVGQDQRAALIRTNTLTVDQRTKLQSELEAKVGKFDVKKTQIDTVGPTIGRQLFQSALVALIVSFAGITLYMTVRFELDYAIFAIVALFHDVLITVGAFAILGLTPLRIEVDSLFVVALLTIVGFSVNDTVVIYDRVRETIALNPGRHINEIVDDAVNQTLTRSINTTLTVLLTLFALLLFGGETLKNFALALIIGFGMGAYSSIFIASTLLALWREKRGRAFAPVKAAEATSD
ncbi:MAG: protein translocase subunit SecF [Phormidium tanganyikae FI6-MK23]|jgi:preprotein translocase subunit SecF|nr:protein translocase subunit SecF [Phormidium tanganyikae FI6-MK23]